MVINDKNNYVTQRQLPEMVLIHTRIEENQLVLFKPSAPDLAPLRIIMDHTPNSTPLTATIWGDKCEVIDEGQQARDWLAEALGRYNLNSSLRLVRMSNKPRPQRKPEVLGKQTHTHFADVAPFLVANEDSLAMVNQQLLQHQLSPVTMENFRPNIVLQGITAFTEHRSTGFTHDDYQFKHCFPCKRCIIQQLIWIAPSLTLDKNPFTDC